MKTLDTLVNVIRSRVRADWDVVVAVTGEEGVGKSDFSVNFGLKLDKMFDLENNISYLPTHQEVIKKFTDLKKYSCYMIDESIKVLDKQQWMDSLQQTIRQMYATERKQNKITLLLMPRFADFAERFRNHRIKIWIHLLARGVGVAFIRDDDKDLGYKDPWHIADNIALKNMAFRRKKVAERRTDDILNVERKTMSYLCDFTWEPLPVNVRSQYDALVSKYKAIAAELEKEKETIENNRLWLGSLCATLNKDYNFSIEELSKMCGAVENNIPTPSTATIARAISKSTGFNPSQFKIMKNNGCTGRVIERHTTPTAPHNIE